MSHLYDDITGLGPVELCEHNPYVSDNVERSVYDSMSVVVANSLPTRTWTVLWRILHGLDLPESLEGT